MANTWNQPGTHNMKPLRAALHGRHIGESPTLEERYAKVNWVPVQSDYKIEMVSACVSEVGIEKQCCGRGHPRKRSSYALVSRIGFCSNVLVFQLEVLHCVCFGLTSYTVEKKYILVSV